MGDYNERIPFPSFIVDRIAEDSLYYNPIFSFPADGFLFG